MRACSATPARRSPWRSIRPSAGDRLERDRTPARQRDPAGSCSPPMWTRAPARPARSTTPPVSRPCSRPPSLLGWPGPEVEIAVLNGEDYYAASGEMAYIAATHDHWHEYDARGQRRWGRVSRGSHRGVVLRVSGRTAGGVLRRPRRLRGHRPGRAVGPGRSLPVRHARRRRVRVHLGQMARLWTDVAHTARDRVELVDPARLAELAAAVVAVAEVASRRDVATRS